MAFKVDIQKVRALIAGYIDSGALDGRVPEALMTNEGFIPKECELWDYKETAGSDAVSKAKTVLQIVSFYNSYGGYIIYGIVDQNNEHNCSVAGIQNNSFHEQQIRMLVKEYTGEHIDFTYIEVPFLHANKNVLLGILYVPKRKNSVSPLFFQKNGPDVKPGSPLFQKDQAYVRLQDNCTYAKDRKSFEFLFGPRTLEAAFPKDPLRLFASRELILDHNLPDRNLICPKFVGRDDIIERLWLWLSDEFAKTRVLAGDGGKGKTSIAYEFATDVCRARPYDLTRVLWVTAKQKQFSGLENDYLRMPTPLFHDLESLLRTLCHEYPLLNEEIEQSNLRQLKKNLRDVLQFHPSLIIVDDIDSVENLDEQKKILEMPYEISSGTSSRFLLTTRMNLISSTDICIDVPGFGRSDYTRYLEYLNERISGPSIRVHLSHDPRESRSYEA